MGLGLRLKVSYDEKISKLVSYAVTARRVQMTGTYTFLTMLTIDATDCRS